MLPECLENCNMLKEYCSNNVTTVLLQCCRDAAGIIRKCCKLLGWMICWLAGQSVGMFRNAAGMRREAARKLQECYPDHAGLLPKCCRNATECCRNAVRMLLEY